MSRLQTCLNGQRKRSRQLFKRSTPTETLILMIVILPLQVRKLKLELLPTLYSKKLRFHVFYVTDFSSESWKETGFHPASKGGDQAFSKAVPPQGDSTGKRWSRQHHANKGGERSEHVCTSKGRSRGHYRNPSALQKGI